MLQLAALIPGPPALPIVSNALLFMTKPSDLPNKIVALFEYYGDYVRFWLGSDLNVVVKNPTDIRSQDVVAKIASAVLVFLAHLPDWQERVYNEILQVLGPQDDNVTEEEWKKLTNLDMVFKEVLRYMTIGPLIQRTVEKEITIKNDTLTIPVGASVVIPIHFVHRDPQNWEEPNKVNPGRFHPDCLTTWDPDTFVPFSLGAMDCIGISFYYGKVKMRDSFSSEFRLSYGLRQGS